MEMREAVERSLILKMDCEYLVEKSPAIHKFASLNKFAI